MGDRVGLQEARPVNVAIVGANRDLIFELPTAAGAAQTSGRVAGARRLEQPIDGGRTDPQQLGAHRLAQRALPLFIKRQPYRQRGLQTLGTPLLGLAPDKLQRLQHLSIVTPAWPWPLASLPRLSVQQPNRILTAITADLAELVQNLTLEPPPHSLVAAPDRQQVFFFRLSAHNCRFPVGKPNYESTAPSPHSPLPFLSHMYCESIRRSGEREIRLSWCDQKETGLCGQKENNVLGLLASGRCCVVLPVASAEDRALRGRNPSV